MRQARLYAAPICARKKNVKSAGRPDSVQRWAMKIAQGMLLTFHTPTRA